MPKWKSFDERSLDQLEKRSRIRSKKSRQKASDLRDPFELDPKFWAKLQEDGGGAYRVVEVHKRYAFVSPEPELGKIDTTGVYLATVAKKFLTALKKERNFICVGDRVFCRPARESEVNPQSELPQVTILNVAPRLSRLARLDPITPTREHVLASNMDQLVFVASLCKPTVKWGLIDRYMVLAESQDLDMHIVLTKKDLLPECDDRFKSEVQEKIKYYKGLGYPVYLVQANVERLGRAKDLKALSKALKDKVSLLSGHSGVGKSSLVNLFEPEIIQETEEDEDIFYKGRHTTSYASFIKLAAGGYLIDTPGIRSFCIEGRSPIELSYCFREFRPYLGQCQFRECRHVDEPGCKILEMLKAGELPEWRYRSFVAILSGASGREGRIREIAVDPSEGG